MAASTDSSSDDELSQPNGRERMTLRARLRSTSRTFASFKNRNYRLFWFGHLFSVTGTWMGRVAQAWLVLQLTESSFALGLVSALQLAPLAFFSLIGGVLADRLPKRRVLLVTQSVMAVQALLLALLVSTGAVEIWHIYGLAFVLGLATAFDNPTRQAFVLELVGQENVSNAVALNSSLFNTARIVGPAISGALIAAFSISVPFYLNTLSFLGVIGALLLMRPEHFHDVPAPVRGPVFTRLREGVAYAARTPEVALPLIVVGFIGTFGYNFSVILPLVARYVLDIGALGFGGLTTAVGAGALVAALTMAYLNRPTDRILLAGAAAFILLLALLAVSTSVTLTMAILVLLGFAGVVFTATANSRLQLLAPREFRGRVMSLYILLFAGTTPIGSLTIGSLAEHFNVEVAILTVAGISLAGLGLGMLYRARHTGTAGISSRDARKEPASDD